MVSKRKFLSSILFFFPFCLYSYSSAAAAALSPVDFSSLVINIDYEDSLSIIVKDVPPCILQDHITLSASGATKVAACKQFGPVADPNLYIYKQSVALTAYDLAQLVGSTGWLINYLSSPETSLNPAESTTADDFYFSMTVSTPLMKSRLTGTRYHPGIAPEARHLLDQVDKLFPVPSEADHAK